MPPDTERVPAAGQPTHIDRWLDSENEEAEKIIANAAKETGETAVLEVPPETPPAEAPAKVEEPPKPEEKKEEPTAPPAVDKAPAAPAVEADAEAPKDGKFPWKQFREDQRALRTLNERSAAQDARLEALQRELEALRQPPAKTAETPPEELDPFTKNERAIASTQAELAEVRRQQEADRYEAAIRQEEVTYRTTQPDYDAAVNYLIANEVREKNAGAAYIVAPRMVNDPATLKRIRETRNDPAKLAQLGQLGKQLGIDELKMPAMPSDLEIARIAALNEIVRLRRDELVQLARAERKSVPEKAYELSVGRGYRKPEPVAAPAPSTNGPTPQQRIQREKEKSEIAESLQSIPSSGAPPMPAQMPKTRAELSALMLKLGPDYGAWQDAMDEADPAWLTKLG